MSVRRNALITLVFQWGGYVLQLVSLVVLARILLPADYGLITMAAAVVGIAAVIGDFGLSLAAIQAERLSQQQKSNLFWLNAGIGAGTGAVVAACAPLIAAFYGEPRLVGVSIALGSVFALNGVAVQFKVELNRALRFSALGATELGSQAIALVAAVLLGTAGAGYWALVAQQVVAAAAMLTLAASLARWRPSRPGSMRETRPLLSFGRDTLLLQITNYVTTNIDSVMVGRSSGPLALGLYNRSYQITVMPILQIVAPLTRVFLPRLSSADDVEFKSLLKRLQVIIVVTTAGPLSLLCALAGTLPVVLFGERWRPLGDLIPFLAAAAFFGILGYIYYWAFLARARTKVLFVAELCGRIPMAALIVVLAPLGPQWVALSVAIGQALVWAFSSAFGPRIGVSPWQMLSAAVRPVVVYALALAASVLVRSALPADVGVLPEMALTGGVWIVVAIGSLAVPAVRSDLRAVMTSVRPGR